MTMDSTHISHNFKWGHMSKAHSFSGLGNVRGLAWHLREQGEYFKRKKKVKIHKLCSLTPLSNPVVMYFSNRPKQSQLRIKFMLNREKSTLLNQVHKITCWKNIHWIKYNNNNKYLQLKRRNDVYAKYLI